MADEATIPAWALEEAQRLLDRELHLVGGDQIPKASIEDLKRAACISIARIIVHDQIEPHGSESDEIRSGIRNQVLIALLKLLVSVHAMALQLIESQQVMLDAMEKDQKLLANCITWRDVEKLRAILGPSSFSIDVFVRAAHALKARKHSIKG